jgi:L-alanine-DL-glutamate epimerase-like enolase superfamily enzyme
MSNRLEKLELHRVRLPLFRPYKLSYRTFEEFEPIIAIADTADGRRAFGEGHISPGSSSETREGGWAFAQEWGRKVLGRDLATARDMIYGAAIQSPVAATALVTAIEALGGHALLTRREPLHVPLLTPVNATEPDAIAEEIEAHICAGFRTLKVKVGLDVKTDLERVRHIQQSAAGRVVLRLDANRGFDREQGMAFARALNPDAIALFEQPCPTDAWDDNAAVAAVSTVPLMLDEPICSLADIERAAKIDGVGFCKVKLKRFSSLEGLRKALEAINELGMGAVLGDGLSSDIACWMEACVGVGLVYGAGEFNGFLKTRDRLIVPSLGFRDGHLDIPAGFAPEIDEDMLTARTIERVVFEV